MTERNTPMLYHYLWTVAGQKPIEMRGWFTPERWEQFKKEPHPMRRDITVSEIPEVLA